MIRNRSYLGWFKDKVPSLLWVRLSALSKAPTHVLLSQTHLTIRWHFFWDLHLVQQRWTPQWVCFVASFGLEYYRQGLPLMGRTASSRPDFTAHPTSLRIRIQPSEQREDGESSDVFLSARKQGEPLSLSDHVELELRGKTPEAMQWVATQPALMDKGWALEDWVPDGHYDRFSDMVGSLSSSHGIPIPARPEETDRL